MTQAELGVKLKKARENIGLGLTEAAKRLGYQSYQTLSKIEAGDREVRVSELGRFSKTYFCKISDFLEPEGLEKAPPALLWRKAPSGARKKELEAEIFKHAEQGVFLERVLGLKQEENFKTLKASPESIRSDTDISDLSNKISDILHLGKRPAFSLQKVLEQDFGIKIFYYDLGLESSAASMVDEELGAVIVINSKEVSWRRNFDLAHELFHIITWGFASPKDLVGNGTFQDIERKADVFASNLLLPSDEVEREIHQKATENQITYGDLVDISIDFGVSIQALLYRMKNLRMLSWEKANRALADPELTERNRKARDKGVEIPPISERLTSLAIRCLRKGHISRGKFAEIVQIKRHEIDDFIEAAGQLNREGQSIEIVAS